jgi:excinuclease ABC subunit C
LPREPGAYLFKNGAGRVLYVGKAKSLRARVRSYFGDPADLTPKVRRTVEQTHEIDVIVAPSEMEALLLEYNLIKEHRPRDNVRYRDDKKYPYLKLTLGETFARVTPTRHVTDDGSRYFGPYSDARAMRQTLRVLGSVFPLPTCKLRLAEGMSERGCLDYFIGRCVGPCRGDVDPADYRRLVDEVILFLTGKKERIVAELEREMARAARELRFEDAARLRDRLFSVRRTVEQQIVAIPGGKSLDVLGVARGALRVVGALLQVRSGKVIGRERLELDCRPEEKAGAILTGLLLGFYSAREEIPEQVLLSGAPADGALLERWLGQRRGGRVHLRVPRRGEGVKLLRMAEYNAEVMLVDGEAGDDDGGVRRGESAAAALARELGLTGPLARIEGVDVSTTQGRDTYASLVVFQRGIPAKAEYRTYRIREAPRRDDPRCIEEVVERRARRIGAGGAKPDLILIDGGLTQLEAALRGLRAGESADVPVISLAKREEVVHLPGRQAPLRLATGSPALQLLQRVRDEAHRFALKAHRRRRGSRVTASVLEEVPGIGPAKRRLLLARFASVSGMRRAGLAEIAAVPGIGRRLALAIWTHLGGAEEA